MLTLSPMIVIGQKHFFLYFKHGNMLFPPFVRVVGITAAFFPVGLLWPCLKKRILMSGKKNNHGFGSES